MRRGQPAHASAVLVGEAGVLIRGKPGSGKSSVVLHLLALDPKSTWLVADDYVFLETHHGRLVASAPSAIAGRLEIRGRGVVERPYVTPVVVRLVVDILPPAECPRMPGPEEATTAIDGLSLPRLMVPIGAPDGAERVRAALADLAGPLMR